MPKERNSNKKSPKFDRDTNTKKKGSQKAENFWKPKATSEMKANESKFARLNQTPRVSNTKIKIKVKVKISKLPWKD